MSHELRTPISGVLGMLEIALGEEPGSAIRNYLEIATESAKTLLMLLNDILDFSKIEAGKLVVESAPFSLRAMRTQAMNALALRAEAKGLHFGWHLADAVPDALLGDQMRLRQALTILVDNAIKFTERGGVDVRTKVESQTATDVKLEFVVADTGVGIARSNLDHIFDPFSQADTSTARRFGGTGLGLAICASLAKLMGGQVWAESELGVGSTFHLTVRLGLVSGDFHVAPKAATSPVEILPSPQSKLRVLLAEDTPSGQLIARYILNARGHAVEVAENGHEALELLQQRDFDLVLMDVQMPIMDGFEATAAIRSAERRTGRHLPVVAMTAHALKGDDQRCLEAGMDAYITKPVDGRELIAVVERLAHKESSPRDSGAAPRILVVDDERNHCTFLSKLLSQRHYEVDVAYDGPAALQLAERRPYRLALIDYRMPGMDGVELYRRIQKLQPEMVVVLVTAYPTIDTVYPAIEAGVERILAKPVSSDELFNVVEQFAGTPA